MLSHVKINPYLEFSHPQVLRISWRHQCFPAALLAINWRDITEIITLIFQYSPHLYFGIYVEMTSFQKCSKQFVHKRFSQISLNFIICIYCFKCLWYRLSNALYSISCSSGQSLSCVLPLWEGATLSQINSLGLQASYGTDHYLNINSKYYLCTVWIDNDCKGEYDNCTFF